MALLLQGSNFFKLVKNSKMRDFSQGFMYGTFEAENENHSLEVWIGVYYLRNNY